LAGYVEWQGFGDADGDGALAFEESGEAHGAEAAPAGELVRGVEVVSGVGKDAATDAKKRLEEAGAVIELA